MFGNAHFGVLWNFFHTGKKPVVLGDETADKHSKKRMMAPHKVITDKVGQSFIMKGRIFVKKQHFIDAIPFLDQFFPQNSPAGSFTPMTQFFAVIHRLQNECCERGRRQDFRCRVKDFHHRAGSHARNDNRVCFTRTGNRQSAAKAHRNYIFQVMAVNCFPCRFAGTFPNIAGNGFFTRP